MKNIDAKIQPHFSNNIFITDIPFELDNTKKLFRDFNFGPYATDLYKNGYTTYFSKDKLPLDVSLKPFVELLGVAARTYAAFQGIDLEKFYPELDILWLNRLGFQGFHEKHYHPNSHMCGTYYVNVPEHAGMLRFFNPLADTMGLIGYPSTEDYYDYKPVEGRLLMWPAWLAHEVLPNEDHKNRDSISFNIRFLKI